ncbi:hypothetical protein FNW52_15840 [Flavobacterium sp. ZT3R18]|uniref:hypothetical protein n=1 Tax=Flavobacterium sp. ZT3R18 TaxID=2594429 RepID=UPI00117B4284|nr:hypothetical protein [Flavobacterium sp. ZT3R18]TRX33229.1 hypothetical protein FNW52_15840 [Flavobacterium sp. ZT3R18]
MTTEELKNIEKYKNYPDGSLSRKTYDRYFLHFEEYLKKYYHNPNFKEWERWYQKYIEPAFDLKRHHEMIKNFGYVSIDKHDFITQYEVYSQLKSDERLDEETKKYVGFLAGAGFFNQFNLSVERWFKINNWQNPNIKNEESKTLNEILNYPYGINYFKTLLTQMPFWRR